LDQALAMSTQSFVHMCFGHNKCWIGRYAIDYC